MYEDMQGNTQPNTEYSQIPVVILCGGRGTRLKEETEIIPKPLVKIGDRPILWHIMKIYSSYGFHHFILLVGYKGEKIKEYFLQYPALRGDFTIDLANEERKITAHTPIEDRWKVTILDTGAETETGARLKRIERHIEGNMFLLTYGDGVANIDLKGLLEFHSRQGKIATVTGVRPPARFGGIAMEGTLATSFWEKPQLQQGYINGGFFVLNRNIFPYLKDDERFNFEKDALPVLARERELAVYRHDGYWQCMDTMRDMEVLQEEWDKGNAPWKIWSA